MADSCFSLVASREENQRGIKEKASFPDAFSSKGALLKKRGN
jgi:hypothetical protein